MCDTLGQYLWEQSSQNTPYKFDQARKQAHSIANGDEAGLYMSIDGTNKSLKLLPMGTGPPKYFRKCLHETTAQNGFSIPHSQGKCNEKDEKVPRKIDTTKI